jgi:hypothetical protein
MFTLPKCDSKSAIGSCVLPSTFSLLLAASCFAPSSRAQATDNTNSGRNPGSAATRTDPKAEEALNRAIQALGGPAFLNFNSLTTRGRLFGISDESTSGLAPFESAVEYPDKRRFSYGKKKPVILINSGDQAWEVDQYGVTDQLPEQVRRWKLANRYSLENLLRLRLREPGMLVQDGGEDFVDNSPAHVVDIYAAGGARMRIYLNRQTFLPIRIAYGAENSQNHEWEEYADVYGDYQRIQEIQTPMHITRFLNGERVSEVFRNSARYNETYPSDYFRPPH